MSLLDKVAEDNYESPLKNAIDSEEPIQYLSAEESSLATEQSKHINGLNGPEIYTEDEKLEADEYELERVLQENEASRINQTIAQSMLEGSVEARLQKDAVISAWERYTTEVMRIPDGLRKSDLIQHQAEADANNAFQVDYAFKNYQGKLDVIDQVRGELIREIRDRGTVEDFFIKFWQAGKDVFPGYSSLLNSDMVSGGFSGIFSPVENRKKLHQAWSKLLRDDTVTPIIFEGILRNALHKFGDVSGTTTEELLRYIDAAFEMDTATAVVDIVADAAVLGGAAKNIAKSTAKHGVSGLALSTTKTLAPYLDAQGTKSFVRGSSRVIHTAKRYGKDLTSVVKRKKLVGDIEGAVETTLKQIDAPSERVTTLKNILGDPDIVNPPKEIIEAGKLRTVIEDVLGEGLTPGESALSDISSSTKIVTEKQYRRLLQQVKKSLDTKVPTHTIEGLERALLHSPLLQKSVEDMMYKITDSSGVTAKIGNIIKTTPVEAFQTDIKDNLVTRVRYPVEFESVSKADNVAKNLNSYYASSFEIVPLPTGRFALDIDMNLHQGFGTLLADAVGSKGRTEWAGKLQSLFATVTGTPDAIRALDYIRTQNTDILEGHLALVRDAVGKLSKAEKDDLENLLRATVSVESPGWYSPERLKAKGFSDNFVTAYSLARSENDLSYLVMNHARRTEMSREGFRSVSVNGKPIGYGREIYPADPEKAITFVKESDRYVVINNPFNTPVKASDFSDMSIKKYGKFKGVSESDPRYLEEMQQFEKLVADTKQVYNDIKSGKSVVVEAMFSPNSKLIGTDILYVLPKNSVKIDELPAYVTHYVPGWRRFFNNDAAYVKQGNINSEGIVTGVNTVFSSTRKNQLSKTTGKIENLRKMLAESYQEISPEDIAQLPARVRDKIELSNKEVLDKITISLSEDPILFAPFKRGEEFYEWCKINGIDTIHADNPLEIVRNKEVPNIVKARTLFTDKSLMSKETIELAKKGTPFEGMLAEWQQRQLHRSGATILNYDFTDAITVDMDKTMQYMVEDMINFGVMSRYSEVYSNAFGDLYRDILIKKLGGSSVTTNKDLLLYADIESLYKSAVDPVTKEKLSQAITAQKNFAALRNIGSSWDSIVATAGNGILKGIGAAADALHIPDRIQNGLYTGFEWVLDKKPLQLARAIAAHRFLGMLNPMQAVKNFLGPVSLAIEAEGKLGSLALRDYFLLLHKLQKPDAELTKKLGALSKALGMTDKEADILWKNLKKLDTRASGFKGGLLNDAATNGKMARLSLFFFNRADTANRIITGDIALRKFGFADKEITNALDIARVGSYQDSLYINMSRRGISRLQRQTFADTLTQFMGYLFKYVETMACDKQLTSGQRWTMTLGTLVAFSGLSGFVGDNVLNAISYAVPSISSQEDDGEITKFLKDAAKDGVFDTVLSRLGFTFSMRDLFSPNILENAYTVTDTSLMELLSNVPALTTVSDYLSATSDLMHFMYNKYFKEMDYLKWSELLKMLVEQRKTFTTAELADRAFEMYKTGMRFSAKGQLVTDDNNILQALMSFAGITDRRLRDIYLSQSTRQKIKDEYEEVLKKATPYYNEGARGNQVAHQEAYLIVESSDLSDSDKARLKQTLFYNAIKQNLVPLEYREAIESAKTKLKTGRGTLQDLQ